MTSPPKPWSNVNFRSPSMSGGQPMGGFAGNPAFLQSSSVQFPSNNTSGLRGQVPPPVHHGQVPPPIPPRPDPLNTSTNPYRYRGYSSYGTYPSPLYSGMYRSYGGMGYGSRMSYGSGYYDAGGGGENDLIRFAEESTRPAFQSIESVVQAVGSVSMMLESTFHALYSSYQAVLGVADQFTRLRNHLTHILSTLALLRSLQWLCLKILYILGVRRRNPSNESAWSAAAEFANGAASAPSGDPSRSAWPIFIFLSVVLGAPWITMRLLSKAAEMRKKEINQWASGGDKSNTPTIGIVLYDFVAQYPQDLSVRSGQKVILAPRHLQPKTKGWLLVSGSADMKRGLVPSNYIKIVGSAPAVASSGGISRRNVHPPNNAPQVPEETADKKQPVASSNDVSSTSEDQGIS